MSTTPVASAPASVLRIIVGSTASGKERLALACAERMGGEIVSVDSMKVYRGLDVATAKAGAAERARVRHHCLDLAEPHETFSAADFVAAAETAIRDIVARGKIPFLSGGTALYYRALLEGLFDGPAADLELRAELEERARREGSDALHRELAALDPAGAAKIHPNDLRRIVRALEVLRLTGDAISGRQTQWEAFHAGERQERADGFFKNPRHPFVMIRIVRDREDVRRRVWERIERMAASGLEAEARRVWETRERVSRTLLQAVGYKEFFPHFGGDESLAAALERLRLGTNKLVRKQDTWFRKFPAAEVFMRREDREEEVAERVAGTIFGVPFHNR